MARLSFTDDGGDGGSNGDKKNNEANQDDDQDWLPLAVGLMDFQRIAAIREESKNNKITSTHESLNAFTPKKKRTRKKDIEQKPKSLSKFQEEEKINKKRARKSSECEEKIKSENVAVPCDKLKTKIEKKGGNEMKLVMTKKLFKTDLSKGHNRLSMPLNQISDHAFLNEEERQKLDSYVEIPVKFMEPGGDDSELAMRKWDYRKQSGSSYALRSGWNNVVRRNFTSKEKFKFQIWSFRVNGELWLTMFKVLDAHHKGNGDGASTSRSTMVNQEHD